MEREEFMKNLVPLISGLALLLIFEGSLFGYPYYFGFSGAPGSRGTCASSCHGLTGGTIAVRGFPAVYQPDQTYTITVVHDTAGQIEQFNGSCRLGTGSVNAGLISAGSNTTTYNDPYETNGVHLLTAQCDSADFLWTAPSSGSDTVRLYLAGTQDTTYNGRNTALVLASAEATGVEETDGIGQKGKVRIAPRPNPFTLFIKVPGHEMEWFTLYDATGKKAGTYRGDRIGEGLAPGVYFLKPRDGSSQPVRIVKIR
jgi:hypothetical protein